MIIGPKARDMSQRPCLRVGWLPFQFSPLTRHFALASALGENWMLGVTVAIVMVANAVSISFFMGEFIGCLTIKAFYTSEIILHIGFNYV